ncbi:MAG: DUF296 domain-containing protein [Candidatus Bathyarchaeia archaeon]
MFKGKIGRVIFSRIMEGEDLIDAIKSRVDDSKVKAGVLSVIGTLKRATLGYYRDGEYTYIHLDSPLEIASCIGNIAVDESGETVIHAHIVVSNEKGEAFGGHLMKGSNVGATAELTVIEVSGVNLQRAYDEKTKLKLFKLV